MLAMVPFFLFSFFNFKICISPSVDILDFEISYRVKNGLILC